MAGRDLLDARIGREPPRETETLAERHELVDLELLVGRVQQSLEADQRAAGMGDDHDRLAAVVDEALDRPCEPGADVRRLDGFVEQDRQVAEPVDQEAVDHLPRGEVADDRDRDAPEQVIPCKDDRADAADQPADGSSAECQRLDQVQTLGQPPVERWRAWSDDVRRLGELMETRRSIAVARRDAGDDGAHPTPEVVDRPAQARSPQVGRPPRLGDDPRRGRDVAVRGNSDLEVRRRCGVEGELGAPHWIVDPISACGRRRPPVRQELDDRGGPVEERLAWRLGADAMNEDDPSPSRDGGR